MFQERQKRLEEEKEEQDRIKKEKELQATIKTDTQSQNNGPSSAFKKPPSRGTFNLSQNTSAIAEERNS